MANATANLPSRMLILRLASSRVVLWALETHGPRLLEILNGPVGQALPPGIESVFDRLVPNLRDMLSVARDQLIVSDRRSRDQRAKTSSFRRHRDEAFKELLPFVMGVRDTFLGACGPEVVEELGFALRTPQHPSELHEQATHLVSRLGDPELSLPVVRYRGVTLEPASLAEDMRPLVEQLGERLEEVSREERLTDAAKIAKDESLKAYDRIFLWAARSAESLFRMADLEEIALRVRPSARRPGLTREIEGQGVDAESAVSETAVEGVPDAAENAEDEVPATESEAAPEGVPEEE